MRPLPTYNTMTECTNATGIPSTVLKEAKRAKCPAFSKSGRIILEKLLRWLFSRPEKEKEGTNWGNELRRWQSELIRQRAEKQAGKMVDVDKIESAFQTCATQIKTILRSRLENEYPTFVAKLEPPEARVFGKRLSDEIIKEFGQLAKEWKR